MVHGAKFVAGLGAYFAGGDDALGILVRRVPQVVLVDSERADLRVMWQPQGHSILCPYNGKIAHIRVYDSAKK